MTWRAEKWSDAVRHEPSRTFPESEAIALLALAKISDAPTVRKMIRKRFGLRSAVRAEFDRLLAQRARKTRVDPQISSEQREEIIALGELGWPPARIASNLRLRHYRVAALLRESRGEIGPRQRLNQETTLNVMRALEIGDRTVSEIAACFHVPESNVRRIARNYRSRFSQSS